MISMALKTRPEHVTQAGKTVVDVVVTYLTVVQPRTVAADDNAKRAEANTVVLEYEFFL